MFRTELELVNEFKRSYSEEFLRSVDPRAIHRFILLEEFDSHNGVADIVFAVYRPYARRTKPRKTINNNWVYQLSRLKEKKIISLDEYVALYGVSSKTARKQLDNFVQADFLKCLKKNHYQISKSYKPILETVISAEAKLRDWQRALAQAYRYKRFSNFAFVLLPSSSAGPAIKNMDLFKRYGIGLVTIGSTGVELHFCPPRRDRLSIEGFLRVNEVAYSQLLVTTG